MARPEKPKVSMNDPEFEVGDFERDTQLLLEQEEKISCVIPREPGSKKGVFYIVPLILNGYTFNVPTGKFVSLPESVYLVGVSSGKISPVRPQDHKYAPRNTVEPIDESGNSAINPIQIFNTKDPRYKAYAEAMGEA